MKYLKTFEGIEEGAGEIPFDKLVIVEIKTIFKSGGVWHEQKEKFAGIRSSIQFPNDIAVWKGGLSKTVPCKEIKKFWVVE
jgi:hypothetical protein